MWVTVFKACPSGAENGFHRKRPFRFFGVRFARDNGPKVRFSLITGNNMSLDLTRDGLRRASERAAELFTEIYCGLEDRSVDPRVTRQQMRSLFEDSIEDEGIGLDRVLEEFEKKILPNSMGTPHPLYFGLVNSSPLPAGPLADLLLSSLNNNGGAFHQSPAMSASEWEIIRQFGRLCGLGVDASGMILPGGTYANLQGLLLARRAHFPQLHKEGPTALSGRPLIYQSDVTHFCNDRRGSDWYRPARIG